MNRLAGPQPYGSGGSVGGPLRRPFFTLQSADTPNGKGRLSPPPPAAEDPGSDPGEELPPAPPTPSRKGPAPFKVTPVPVAAKPERFPGTTVEEILAKMDSREGPGGREQARLVPFCPDPSSRFGSRTFTALRRCPSKEADAAPPGEAPQTPQSAVGKPGVSGDGRPVAEMSSSPSAGPGCAGDPRGCCQTPSPPDLSLLQPSTLGPPGSPRPPTCPAPALGAPFQPTKPSAPAPGSPSAPQEFLAPRSPTLASSSPESPAQLLAGSSTPAPGAPSSAADHHLGTLHSPGSPHAPDEGSPCTTSPPGTPKLSPRVTCPPGCPETAADHPVPPSPPPTQASRPPGSPEEPDDSPVSLQLPEGLSFGLSLPSRASGLRRSSEGVLKTPATGQGLGELGGSMKALPHPGDPLPEPPLGSDSGWSLSQSFEWTFPSQGARRPASPLQSPIVEADYSGLSEDGEDAAPSPPRSQEEDSGSDDSRGAEGSPCPGGPVALRETKALVKEEEEKKEEDAAVPCSPPCVTEPVQDLPEPESQVQPGLADTTLLDVATEAGPAAAWVPSDDCARSPQGPGGPCRTGGSSNEDPPGDPGWLAELLASPRPLAQGCSEGLLGWSRKDLCWEFGVRAPHAGAFDWSREAVAGETGWPGESERELGTKPGWSGPRSAREGDQPGRAYGAAGQDWSSGYRGTELVAGAPPGCGDRPEARGAGGSCPQRPDLGPGLGAAGGQEEVGAAKAGWSSSHSVARGQQRDAEPSSGQPSWASRPGPGDLETRHGEVTPAWAGGAEAKHTTDWAGKCSSRRAESRDGDLTLGWAGRTSTEDPGSLEKECSPSRAAWGDRHSSGDMESQDREFSPSRPAEASKHSTGDTEPWHGQFSPSRPTWEDRYSMGDVGTRDRDTESQNRDTESQDREFSPSRPAEASKHSTSDSKPWHREFSPGRPTWEDRYSMGDMGTQDQDTESQDREFSPSRPAWAGQCSTQSTEGQHSGVKSSRPAWGDTSSTMETWDSGLSTRDTDTESQDRELSPSKHSTSDTEPWHRQFSPGRPTWEDRYSMGDMGTWERDTESQDWEFSPSRPALEGQYSMGDMGTQDRDTESQDREFKSSGAAEATEHPGAETWGSGLGRNQPTWDDRYSIRAVEACDGETGVQDRDTETQHWGSEPRQPVGTGRHGSGDLESQHWGFSPSQPAEAREYPSTRGAEPWDERFSPSQPSWAGEFGSRGAESRDSGLGSSQLAWAGRYGARGSGTPGRDAETPDRFPCADRACGSAGPEWADGERGRAGAAQPKLGQATGGQDSLPGSGDPDPPLQEHSWRSAHQQEHSATGRRDWPEELGTAHSRFGIVGTERVPDPHGAAASPGAPTTWTDGTRSEGEGEPPGAWHGDLSFHSSGVASDSDLGEPGWSTELRDAEAKRREWASAFGARCAARSRDCSAKEQSLGSDARSADGSILLPDPSPPTDDAPAMFPDADPSQSELPGPTEEEQDPPDLPRPLKEEQDPPETLLLSGTFLGAVGGTLPDVESEGAPSDHLDGKRPPSWEKQLPLGTPQPEAPVGQEFAFLEDTEVLDSSMYRTKASLGRKRRHRAPALRPGAATEGDAWIFWDSTEPRPVPPAASSDEDEEAVEEPKSRRARAFPAGRGVKVPLFPGLSTAALKAKLRGRNRSAEEGSVLGDSRGTPPKDSHLVQRSKSCKILGLSGKPPALPPKPDKSSGSEASPPHWLQALKLKKKKP